LSPVVFLLVHMYVCIYAQELEVCAPACNEVFSYYGNHFLHWKVLNFTVVPTQKTHRALFPFCML